MPSNESPFFMCTMFRVLTDDFTRLFLLSIDMNMSVLISY